MGRGRRRRDRPRNRANHRLPTSPRTTVSMPRHVNIWASLEDRLRANDLRLLRQRENLFTQKYRRTSAIVYSPVRRAIVTNRPLTRLEYKSTNQRVPSLRDLNPVTKVKRALRELDPLVCVKRSIRREVLNALGKTGKAGQKSPVWNELSKIKCRRK